MSIVIDFILNDPLPWAITGVGLLVGLALTLGDHGEHSNAEAEGAREDLQQQHDEALLALKELESDKEKLAPDDYKKLRDAHIKKGAAALRALKGTSTMPTEPSNTPIHPSTAVSFSDDFLLALAKEQQRLGASTFLASLSTQFEFKSPSPSSQTTAPSIDKKSGMGAEWKGALWALLGVLCVGGASLAIQGNVSKRGDRSMTGGPGNMGPSASAGPVTTPAQNTAPDPEKAKWESALAQNPESLEALNALTEIAFGERDLQSAMAHNAKVLELKPDDLDGQVYRAVLFSAIGKVDDALKQLDEVLAKNPTLTKALVYQGLIALDNGKPKVALAALEKAAQTPEGQNPFLQQRLESARAQANGAPAPTRPSRPAPSGVAEPIISGTITLDPSAAAIQPGDQLFIAVKGGGGPPLAAKKLQPGPFPMNFSISTADAISMGGAPRPFPAKMTLSVRIDRDGNAMTREAGLPAAIVESVPKGIAGVSVVLK